MTTTLTAFTTTHRVINRVHNDTTVVRTTTEPAAATSLTRLFESVVGVTDGTDSSFASTQNLACFTRRELNHTITALTRSQLSEVTSRTDEQSTLTGTQLNVVNHRTHRNVCQRKRVTDLRCSLCTTHELSAYLQSIRSNNVTFFTICVVEQSDASAAVRIVLDALYDSRHTIFLSLEVDETKFTLVATALVAYGHLTGVVSTTGRTLTVNERLLWHGCSNILERANNLVSLSRSNRV